ncbi:hypothetical protein ACFXPV_29265 [Streptomyces sp. NPDC059118]|uniref:hypothetical protein n=1 Tax=unclassified Streptomyces TaxID=2593676 RepID=UPI0036815CFD
MTATGPDGTVEREQRRAHQIAQHETDQAATASCGFCRGGQMTARSGPRGRQSCVFILSAVRHHDASTAALHEIGAKTNEIPELAPLLDTVDTQDLTGSVVAIDALHKPGERDSPRGPDLSEAVLYEPKPEFRFSGALARLTERRTDFFTLQSDWRGGVEGLSARHLNRQLNFHPTSSSGLTEMWSKAWRTRLADLCPATLSSARSFRFHGLSQSGVDSRSLTTL